MEQCAERRSRASLSPCIQLLLDLARRPASITVIGVPASAPGGFPPWRYHMLLTDVPLTSTPAPLPSIPPVPLTASHPIGQKKQITCGVGFRSLGELAGANGDPPSAHGISGTPTGTWWHTDRSLPPLSSQWPGDGKEHVVSVCTGRIV